MINLQFHLYTCTEYLRPRYPCYVLMVIGPQLQLFLAIVVFGISYTEEISAELAKRKMRRLDPDLDAIGA